MVEGWFCHFCHLCMYFSLNDKAVWEFGKCSYPSLNELLRMLPLSSYNADN